MNTVINPFQKMEEHFRNLIKRLERLEANDKKDKPSKWIDRKEVSKRTGLNPRRIAELEAQGVLRNMEKGAYRAKYLESDIEQFLKGGT